MQPDEPAIKVAIIEDQREVRDGLGYLIGSTPGYQFTGGYGSIAEGLRGFTRQTPDLALVDIGLPEMDGIAGTRLLKSRWPELVVVTLTVYEDDERIFAALCACHYPNLCTKLGWKVRPPAKGR